MFARGDICLYFHTREGDNLPRYLKVRYLEPSQQEKHARCEWLEPGLLQGNILSLPEERLSLLEDKGPKQPGGFFWYDLHGSHGETVRAWVQFKGYHESRMYCLVNVLKSAMFQGLTMVVQASRLVPAPEEP